MSREKVSSGGMFLLLGDRASIRTRVPSTFSLDAVLVVFRSF